MISTDLHQMSGFTRIIGAMCDCWTVRGCPQLDSGVADCGAVGLDDLIFRRTRFPPHDCSAGCDQTYTEDYSIVWDFPHIESAVDAATGAVELDDLNFRLETIYCWICGLACQCALDQSLGHSISDIPTDLYAAVSARQSSLLAG